MLAELVHLGLGLWCLTIYRGGQFYWWGNRSTGRKPPTCCKSQTKLYHI